MIGQLFWLELPEALISILLAYYFLTLKVFTVRYALTKLSARRDLIPLCTMPLGALFSGGHLKNLPQSCLLLYAALQSIWLNVHNLRI